MLFFVQTTRFYPTNFEKMGFIKVADGVFLYSKDKSIWKARELLDLGYGKEHGLVRQPALNFDQLIVLALAEYDEHACEQTYNLWGALSVLIDDYCLDFLTLLGKKYTKEKLFTEHRFVYNYLNVELNLDDNFIKRLGNDNFAQCCHQWKKFIETQ